MRGLLFLITLLLAPVIIFEQTLTPVLLWSKVTDHAAFSPRDGAGAIEFHDEIWLMGGWNKDSVPTRNSEVWTSENGKDWELLNADAPWPERHSFGLIEYQDKLWVIGGDGRTDVWNSTDGIQWNLVTDSVPWGQRYKPYVLVFHDTIWVMGGFDYYSDDLQPYQGQFIAYNDVWFSVDGLNWTQATDDAGWEPRGIIHGSVVFNDKMWIISGGLYATGQTTIEIYYDDVWSSPDGINWTCVNDDAPWLGRIHHNIAVFDNKMWLMAGHNKVNQLPGLGALKKDVWYSADGEDWTQLPGTPWAPTHAASVFVYDDALWLAAGYLKNDVWKLSYTPPEEIYAETEFELDVDVFPNPAADFINISLRANRPDVVDFNVFIFDMGGNLVESRSSEISLQQTEIIDLSDFASGIYVISIVTPDQTITEKFFVSHS